ncbi:MAG: CHAT domain-containing protein [Nostocaceae cyanobacterium]|nr:CHAT domain-containing protein [Nostocaceae cyanobacterium]
MALTNCKNTLLRRRKEEKIYSFSKFSLRRIKGIFFILLLAITFLFTGLLHPTWAYKVANNSTVQSVPGTQNLVERGKQLYAIERYAEAVKIWSKAISAFTANRDELQQAMTLGNLSLAYQQLGQWSEAQIAITQSLNLLGYTQQQQKNHSSIKNPQILAQILDIQGRLHLAQNKPENALNIWQKAVDIYETIGDKNAVIRNRINQAQAMQALGFYRRAEKTLTETNEILAAQTNTPLKVTGLRSLGNVVQVTGDLKKSREVLKESLEVAKSLSDNKVIGDILVSLGNTARAQEDTQAAIKYYQKAAKTANSPITVIQSLVNQFSLLVDNKENKDLQGLSSQIQTRLAKLPPSRTAIFARINFAQSLIELNGSQLSAGSKKQQNFKDSSSQNPYLTAAQLLADSVEQARNLQDKRTESYALGILGKVYEKNQQWDNAQKLTQEALFISQSIGAEEITYQWQWQLGRLFKAKGNIENAISFYDKAVNTIKSLRYDLFAVNPQVKFSFQEDIEPVYRERVDLLLNSQGKSEINPINLEKASETIELLQIAQLNNFFRNNCLETRLVQKQENPTAVVIYPFILKDRLSVVVQLPSNGNNKDKDKDKNKKWLHYESVVNADEVKQTLNQLQRDLPKPHTLRTVQKKSQKVYNWLIQPKLEAALKSVDNPTLVFVLDGVLRNVPPAVLYDGKQYLIEKYNIALIPSQQLVEAKPLQKDLRAIAAGLSEPSAGFSPLPNVKRELEQITSQIPSNVLLNEEFTSKILQERINSLPYPVLHLATHGKFSSKAEETFIVAWNNERIYVKDFNKIVRTVEQNKPEAIELLVLSACQTALGDEKAALGIAGVAFQAGARSTIASLWNLDDESTSILMSQFYQELANKKLTKAQALRNAQIKLLKSRKYKRPRYWAPYILFGNWL